MGSMYSWCAHVGSASAADPAAVLVAAMCPGQLRFRRWLLCIWQQPSQHKKIKQTKKEKKKKEKKQNLT
jgi:uncharacterized protein YecA (UPF0149 family)